MILSYVRTIVLYLILVAVIRLLGKRQVGEMEPSEFVVTMLIANLASIPMQDGALALMTGLIPILTVLGLELVLSWLTLRSPAMRRLLCGSPVILIDNGRILEDNLRSTRITVEELTALLRQKDAADISTVQYAILETNGSLSVFPYPREGPVTRSDAGIELPPGTLPLTVLADGTINRENLARRGKKEAWLDAELARRGLTRRRVLLLTLDEDDRITLIPKEELS